MMLGAPVSVQHVVDDFDLLSLAYRLLTSVEVLQRVTMYPRSTECAA
jgi:hypothetical protein